MSQVTITLEPVEALHVMAAIDFLLLMNTNEKPITTSYVIRANRKISDAITEQVSEKELAIINADLDTHDL